jgi:hypothetical protein
VRTTFATQRPHIAADLVADAAQLAAAYPRRANKTKRLMFKNIFVDCLGDKHEDNARRAFA